MAADLPDRRFRPARPPAAGRIPRRVTDRVEDALAWLLTSIALLAVVAGVVAGVTIARDGAERARAEAQQRTQVQVVLLEAAEVVAAPDGFAEPVAVQVSARWLLPDGTQRVAPVSVGGSAAAGAVLTRWVDDAGNPAAAPSGSGAALLDGVLHGVLVVLLGWAGTGLSWWAVRRWAAVRNSAGWARGWRQVEPVWSGRPRG